MRPEDFIVAIIGRPNVGKSTLFNRLVGKRLALVDDQPGVTRDRRTGTATLSDLKFTIMDTAGLEDAHDESLEARMRRQTEQAILDADLALLLVDARAGVTPLDEHFAQLLRKGATKIALIANKCEGRAGAPGLAEAYGLGMGEPIPISAEHGEGMPDLYQLILNAMTEAGVSFESDHPVEVDEDVESPDEESPAGDKVQIGSSERPLQLAIVGRPNVGKSTLINRYLGEDRLLTGPEAGITRDSIAVEWAWKGKSIKLIDTAGLRRKARVEAKVERLSAADTRRAIDFAHVVVLLLDARDMLEKQDLTIARQTIEEGRALIVAANKWDLVEDKPAALQKLRDRLQTSLPQVRGVPVVTMSALEGRNLDRLLKSAFDIFQIWNKRISTSRLNEWLSDKLEIHPPPMVSGRRVKLRYMTQAGTRPPTFAIFSSRAEALPDSYTRYLANGIRDDFGLEGVPLRLNIRQGKNPYATKRK